MKVGSMSRDWAVGGMKGVAVESGEQAEAEIRVNRRMSRLVLPRERRDNVSLIEGLRLGMRRSIS